MNAQMAAHARLRERAAVVRGHARFLLQGGLKYGGKGALGSQLERCSPQQ